MSEGNRGENPESIESKERPGQRGDRVVCNINGKEYSGTIFNTEFSGGNLIGILLDEKIEGSNYLGGYGTSIGYELLSDTEKIRKTGEASEEEMSALDERLEKLTSY